MPLKHGKSEKAFEHNIKAEMHAGKPQKQALAIAYSVKRKAQHKKMAKGGEVPHEDMAREYDKEVFDEQPNHNEDLNPGPDGAPKVENEPEEHISHMAQSHEELPEPQEPMKHYMPAEEDLPAHMMAHGGMFHPEKIAHAIRMKKMAQGGEIPRDEHYLDENDSYPDPEHEEFDIFDMHKPQGFAEGGDVKEKPSPSPSPSSDKKNPFDTQAGHEVQESMRKAFKFAEGGEAENKMKKRIHQILMKRS